MTKVNTSSTGGWRPTKTYLRWVESNAAEIRERAGVGATEKLDPRARAAELNIVIAPKDYVDGFPEEIRSRLRQLDPKDWSGMGKLLPNNQLLVMLNPNQTEERDNVTILEEVAHIHYEHQPAGFDEFGGRRYNEENEREAYQTAAAALLPMKIIAQSVWKGQCVEDVAREYGVSVDLVEMRIKLLRLWGCYKN